MRNLPESINTMFKDERYGGVRYRTFSHYLHSLAANYNFDVNAAKFLLINGADAIAMLKGNGNVAIIGLSELSGCPNCVLVGYEGNKRIAWCEGLDCRTIGFNSAAIKLLKNTDVIVIINKPVDIADQKFIKQTRKDNCIPSSVIRDPSQYYDGSAYDKSGYKSTLVDRYVARVINERRPIVSKFVESVSEKINQIVVSMITDRNMFDRSTRTKLDNIKRAIESVNELIGVDGYRWNKEPDDNIKGMFSTDKSIVNIARRITSKQLTEQQCIDKFRSVAKI